MFICYIRPTFLPEATLPLGPCPAELSATSAYLNYTNVLSNEHTSLRIATETRPLRNRFEIDWDIFLLY
jgi:hypothetical protein